MANIAEIAVNEAITDFEAHTKRRIEKCKMQIERYTRLQKELEGDLAVGSTRRQEITKSTIDRLTRAGIKIEVPPGTMKVEGK